MSTLFYTKYVVLLTLVDQMVDNSIHRINLCTVDNAIGFPYTYPVDSDLHVFYVLGLVDSAECNAEPPLTEYHTHKLNRHAQGRVHQHAKLAGGPNPASPYKDT